MNWILTSEEIREGDRRIVGGKGFALSRLVRAGFTIHKTLTITSDAYEDYLDRSGLRERILLELHARFDSDQQAWARKLLDLARNSYQLRDDDNIYLGRIEAQFLSSLREARRRLAAYKKTPLLENLRQLLVEVEDSNDTKESAAGNPSPEKNLKSRQMTGNPPGRGLRGAEPG